MRTDAQRIAKYIAKTTPTTVGLKVAERLAGMNSGFVAAINDLAPKEAQIQALLNGEGIATVDYPFYLSFGRELWHLDYIGVDGASAIVAAQLLHTKYVDFGCATAIIKKIANDLFGIVIP